MFRGLLLPLFAICSSGALWAQETVLSETFRTNEAKWVSIQKGNSRFTDRGLEIVGPKGIRYEGDAKELSRRLRESNAITLEIWFRPEHLKQNGPARILTFSRNSVERNFTIGQDGNKVEVRLRTTRTGNNGTPGLASKSGSLKTDLSHVVFTRKSNGDAVLYLNGEIAARKRIEGDFSNWNSNFQLGVGDEFSGGRPWKGRILSFSILDDAIRAEAVAKAYEAGGGKALAPEITKAPPKKNPNEELFETSITTILTQHCLECHDSATAKGDLDLSKKLASHTEDGILVPGKAADSLLWESIESDEMPDDRPPLSKEEKQLIRKWIEGGADWTVAFIDPAIYSRPAEVGNAGSRRLTVSEYIATVKDTFGVDIQAKAQELLPEDVRADGFSNTAYNLTVDLGHVEAYSQLANEIVTKLDVGKFAKRFSNKRDLTDKTMIALIEAMGERVLRGPLDRDEKALYRGISTTVASAGGDFEDAVGYVLEAMCQSPRFLYRIEEKVGGNSPRLLDDYELASRISYTIWGSSPDEELLRAARDGRLNSEGEIRSQAQRMFRDPLAVSRSLQFASDWLHLDRLDHMQPGEEHFPDWDPELAALMKAETLAFFEHVVWEQKAPLSALMNSRVSFLNKKLAEHYGVTAQVGDGELERVNLENTRGRGGLLTQGSVLTIGGDEASMVSRGLFVLNDLMRGVVKDPPPGVKLVPVPSQPGLTQRGIAIERISDKACGGCHERFEPLAYGLEKFDGLGAFHEKDEFGNELKEDGEVLFPGDSKPTSFQTIEELMDILANSSRVQETITWKLTQFAMGRPLNARDAAAVQAIHKKSGKAGGRYADVLSAIVSSDLFRYAVPDPASISAN